MTPTAPVAAAVVSEPMAAPTSTPCAQSRASNTSGTRLARRPPKTMALIGTPCGASACGVHEGHWRALTVKREFGCAAGPLAGSYGRPCQSSAGTRLSRPSHQGWPSSVTATLVKMVSRPIVCSAFGFEPSDVPGATPKNPASGLIAHKRPASPGSIPQMYHAEEPRLGVDRPQAAVLAGVHPADVVAHRPHLPALLAVGGGRDQHGQVGLAAGARE